jgi:lysophospholipase L1-like esterase
VLLLHAPEAVLLMEGANDIARDDGADQVPIAADAIEEKVLQAQESGAVVFLATLPPQVPEGKRAKGAPFVPLMNDAIRRVASRTKATLVDVHKAFDGKPLADLVDWDGLHLKPAGYLLVAETFFQAIKKELEVEPGASGVFPP